MTQTLETFAAYIRQLARDEGMDAEFRANLSHLLDEGLTVARAHPQAFRVEVTRN